MKLGIINTRCQRKKSLFNLFKKKIVENKYNFKALVIVEKNIYLSEKRMKKHIERIEKNLCSQVDLTYREDYRTKSFFLELCIILYREIINNENLKPYKLKVLIYDGELSVLNKSILERLCFILSECHIISNKKEPVFGLCDYMKSLYGATYRVCEEPDLFKYDAIIDLDNLLFRMGRNIYINNLDFNFSDIEEKLHITQINLATFLFYKGYKVKLKKIEGRKAYFKLDL